MNSAVRKNALAALATAVCAVFGSAYSVESWASASDSCAKDLNPAQLGPDSIIGEGPHGAAAASMADVQLTEEEAEKVRAGEFRVGLVMHTMNLDWTQLQLQGIRDTFDKYGVEIIGTTAADYQVSKQIGDIENTIQRRPDGIISIPVDNTATAPAYEKVSEAGIDLVFMDNVPQGLNHPEQYASMVSADSQGNGWVAAEVLASCIPEGGTVGIINFGIDFFVTNERTKGVKDWMKENRPDIKIKQADFTDTSKVTQVAGDFLTANPDVQGLFAVWDAPALDTLSAMRAQGASLPLTTIDLSLQSALEIAKGSPLKGTGSQRPYDQGVAEALALMKAMIGEEPPAWVGVPALPVIESNVLEAYETVFHAKPPQQLLEACKKNPDCG